MAKRLGLYVTYDKDGLLSDYIVYFLKEFRQWVDELIVVSNQVLVENEKEKIKFVDKIFERTNSGYDVGAIADTLTNLYGWKEVQKFDEVVFMNDSVFGPFYSLEPVFQEMELRTELDFWGLTKRAESDFDGGEVIYPEHIQSYFYVVKSRMLNSKEFVDYWEHIMERVTDFRSAIINYEFAFTKYFAEKGFKWDVVVKLPGYKTDNPRINLSPYHYSGSELVRSGKYPFIKRKLFDGDFVYSKYSDKSDLRRAFDYVREQTEYDENLVWNFVLKNYKLGNVMESLCLQEIVTEEKRTEEDDEPCNSYKVIDVKNDSIKLEHISEKYIFLLLLEKHHNEPEALWNARRFTVVENLMRNEQYIKNIIALFEKKECLGVLVPPMHTYGAVTSSVQKKWCDKERAEAVYQKLNLQVPFSEEEACVHEINALWCRKELLVSLEENGLLENIDETLLQLLPLVAQNQGYFTEIIENVDYVKYHLTGMQELTREFLRFLEVDKAESMTLEECETQVMQQRVREQLKTNSDVYIYGAGERAYRLILAIQKFAKIKKVIVSDSKGNPERLLGYTVESVENLTEKMSKSLVVVTVGKKYRNEIAERLEKLGFADYIFV